jgi:pseudouridine-5'-phosphate glycosidase
MPDLLDVRPTVAEALAAGSPVVALESTLISHGLPHPHNVQTALAMESAIRERGATPATIALRGGRAVVGVSPEEIDSLATARDVTKVSRRDLPAVLAAGGTGATTVAATICLAARAGISMMATGGLGGVHRGGESSLDVSADLYELARVPVAVVCAGAKSILDLPRTLELLESLGVPVVGYRTDELPAFYSSGSGHPTSARVDSPAEAARLLAAQRALGLESGTLLVQPPPEEHALPFSTVEGWIAQAIEEADATGVTGSRVTPFLLERVTQLSEGRTLAANVALLVRNAELAADVAVAFGTLTPL